MSYADSSSASFRKQPLVIMVIFTLYNGATFSPRKASVRSEIVNIHLKIVVKAIMLLFTTSLKSTSFYIKA